MNDSLGDRMKDCYESRWNIKLPRRMPCILRLDGKAFHTLTHSLERPFDKGFIELMQDTARYLCEEVQGVQIAYVQSDEISLFLHDYKQFVSQAWFDKELQKIVSVSSGLASAYFSVNSWKVFSKLNKDPQKDGWENSLSEFNKIGVFDSRAFILPEIEVCNYFLWRQRDCIRNSIQALGQSIFSQKELQNVSTSEIKDMCKNVGYNWDDLQIPYQRGSCVIKESYTIEDAQRSKWIIDNEIPLFSENRNYIEKYLEAEK